MPAALLEAGVVNSRTRDAQLAAWLGDGGCDCGDPEHHDHHDHHGHHDHHHHDHAGHRHGTVNTVSILSDAPLPIGQMEEFINLVLSMHGDRLLRMKAMLLTRENPTRPLVVHAVRRFLHPPVFLREWPASVRPNSRFVLIGERLDEGKLRDLFAAFAGGLRSDAPDRAALMDNPLAIRGG